MAILIVFIGAIIAITFIASFSTDIVFQTETRTTGNQTVNLTTPSATEDLIGRTLVGSAIIRNVSDNSTVTGNYTVTNEIGSDGLQTPRITASGDGTFNGENLTASILLVEYTYEPTGYLQNSGARGINKLTLIIAALAILVFVIVVFIGKGYLGKLMGRS